jgi:predicted  nucleic acid-binding Zn-ribbon protein
MNENWNNGKYELNGRVNPPIVLHSEKELFIAQNAHNMIWGKYRREYEESENEIKTLKGRGEDPTEARKRINDIRAKAKPEIDALINEEIQAYRNRYQNDACPLAERIRELEDKLEELTKELDDVRSIAEDAESTAEEAESNAEDAESTAKEALEKAEEALNKKSDDD